MPSRRLYAGGKQAFFMCDRCGQKKPYTEAQTDWQGFRVCMECFEPKHPQLKAARHVTDAQALFKPRPDKDDMGTVETQIESLFPHTAGAKRLEGGPE